MNSLQIEILIEEKNEREREECNRILRARLARRRSREELLDRLGELMEQYSRSGEGEIPLTNSSIPAIMETAR